MTSNNNSNQWRYINMDNRIIRLIIVLVVFRHMEIIINFVHSLGLLTNKRKDILRIHSDKSEMTK